MELNNYEKWEDLTISNDFIFSKVMRDKDICKEVIEMITDRKYSKIEYDDYERPFKFPFEYSSVKIYAYEENNKDPHYIEMLIANEETFSLMFSKL